MLTCQIHLDYDICPYLLNFSDFLTSLFQPDDFLTWLFLTCFRQQFQSFEPCSIFLFLNQKSQGQCAFLFSQTK